LRNCPLHFRLSAGLVKTPQLESGIVKIAPVVGDVYELVNAAFKECAKIAADKGVIMTTSCSGGITARFDPRWCGEVLVNISNQVYNNNKQRSKDYRNFSTRNAKFF
jgi:hypothetical protein